MVKTRTANTAKNILTGFIYRFVHIFMPFILRSVIINVLGKEYLGLNTLFTSIFTFLNLAEFGFANAITFRMYKPAKENDYRMLSIYASVIRKVYKILGIFMIFVGIAMMPFLKIFISGTYPVDIDIYLLYGLYLLNIVIPYLGAGYCVSIFNAFQRIDIPNIINAVITLCMNIVQILIVLLTRNYYLYIICLPIFTCVTNFLFWKTKNKEYANINVNKKIDGKILKDTFKSSGALFGHSLNYVIVSVADNLVISSFMGLSVLAVYGNYYTVFSAVIGLIDIVLQSCTPSIGNLLVEHDRKNELKIFKSISFLTYWVSGWCSICLICLYQPFIKIWMGEGMLLPFSTVLLFAAYLYSYKGRAAVLAFKDAAGLWKADWLKPYFSGFVNIILNIVLINIIGINGVLISTVLVFCFINFPWETQIILKGKFNEYRKKYYLDFLKYLVINLLIGTITVCLCMIFKSPNNFAVLTFRSVICMIVPNIIWIMTFYKIEEFNVLKSKIKSLYT